VSDSGNLSRQQGWNGVTNLRVLLSPITAEKVVIRKGLKPRGLSNCQASALVRLVMDIVMPVFGHVAHYRRRRRLLELHAEAVCEIVVPKRMADIAMVWIDSFRKIP
jgi:hypothetical protein